MQTTKPKEGIDIVEGIETVAEFMCLKVKPFIGNKSGKIIGILLVDEDDEFDIMEELSWYDPSTDFNRLIDAIKKFQELYPVPAFPQWVTWCEQINNTLIETYEPLPVFYVLVEAVKDYNLHIQ